MSLKRKSEGKSIKEKPEDKIWREEFNKLTLSEHDQKLKELGLDEEDIEEFNEKFEGEERSINHKEEAVEGEGMLVGHKDDMDLIKKEIEKKKKQ